MFKQLNINNILKSTAYSGDGGAFPFGRRSALLGPERQPRRATPADASQLRRRFAQDAHEASR